MMEDDVEEDFLVSLDVHDVVLEASELSLDFSSNFLAIGNVWGDLVDQVSEGLESVS